jgi:hypothetical protein
VVALIGALVVLRWLPGRGAAPAEPTATALARSAS